MTDTTPIAAAPPSRRRIWAFHVVAAGIAWTLLLSMSYPGVSDLLMLMFGAFASVTIGAVWLAWVIVVAVRTGRRWWWFLIGPVIGVLTVTLMVTGAPFKLRWAVARGSFEAIVAGHAVPPVNSEWVAVNAPGRIGTYDISRAYWVPGGALFFESTGALFDDAGFAYFPAGPNPDLENGNFERPQYESLGGGWYTFVSSW